nr:CMF_HP1_G0006490.mRNA.1.CDS.1 [Saccharomyces cerevisiae]
MISQFILSTTLYSTDDEGHVLKLENLHVVSKSSIEKDPSPEILVCIMFAIHQNHRKRYRLAPKQLSAGVFGDIEIRLNIDRNNSTNQHSNHAVTTFVATVILFSTKIP